MPRKHPTNLSLSEQVKVAEHLRTLLSEGDDNFWSYTVEGVATDDEAVLSCIQATGIQTLTVSNLRHIRGELFGPLRRGGSVTGRASDKVLVEIRDVLSAQSATISDMQEGVREAHEHIVKLFHALAEINTRVDKIIAFKGAGYGVKE